MTYPHITMTLGAHDRAGLNRADQEWLDATWADPATRVLVLARGRLRPSNGRPDWLPTGRRTVGPAGAAGRARRRVALRGPPRRGARASRVLGGAAGGRPEPGRRGAGEAPLIFHAFGVAEWHRVTKFCPLDGAPFKVRFRRPRTGLYVVRPVPSCRADRAQAVIMIVASGDPGSEDERCLLGRNASWPPGRYSTLAGFVEPGGDSGGRGTPGGVRGDRGPSTATSTTSGTNPGRFLPA